MKKNNLATPIVKWVGGKRQLLPEINKYLPKIGTTTYYEPFVGGGAVLFNIQPKNVILNDFNHELINTYQMVKEHINELIEDLSKHQNTSDYFYTLRELDRTPQYNQLSPIQKASRLLYLNKTCFNGLFRVNRAGEFNSPFGGYKNPNIVNETTLRAVSYYFNNANIIFKCGDFEEALQGIKKNSFVYFDPPYDPISTSSNFTGYTNEGFDRTEQERLKLLCDKLNQKGIKFLLSNSATDFIINLYKDYRIELVKAKRSINSNASLRGEINEVLIRNYE